MSAALPTASLNGTTVWCLTSDFLFSILFCNLLARARSGSCSVSLDTTKWDVLSSSSHLLD